MPGWLTWHRSARAAKTRSSVRAAVPSIASVLVELEIRHFDEDLLRLSIKKLEGYFGDPIPMDVFLRNIIWQIYEQIQAGTPPDFYHKRGFIRGMWYHIKTPLSRHNRFRKDLSGQMGRELQRMVEKGLVSYVDFNFQDKDAAYKAIGLDNPHIIIFGEKDGFIYILRDIHETYGCTVITTGGQGSFLSINYLASGMVEAGIDITQEFICVSIVDFDPVGWNIGDEFIEKLQNSGVKTFRRFNQYKGTYENEKGEKLPYRWLDIIQPKNLPARELDRAKYEYKPKVKRKPSTAQWAQSTGGVFGDGVHTHGISADYFTAERMIQLVGEAIQPFIQVDPETAKRTAQVRKLEKALEQLLLYKVLRRPGSGPPAPGGGG